MRWAVAQAGVRHIARERPAELAPTRRRVELCLAANQQCEALTKDDAAHFEVELGEPNPVERRII
jgi:hypothetical protein